ncbi:MAG: helix-turn-helix domain-containing protein [Candidatus Synoicihabitans palmerolidicus]|nr:helix-turn-helix domain-containing protein [Candidatus Synoicihabitans palmerolidicus]
MERVTLKAVALAARVHPSTASLALRNRSRIPLTTRERIALIAREMGYQPDPVLAALNAYRVNLQAPDSGVATLGWMVIRTNATATPTPACVIASYPHCP